MKVSNDLEKFIFDHRELIDRNDFEELYELLVANRIPAEHITDFTILMYAAGINVTRYLSYIPRYFFSHTEEIINTTIPENIKSIHSYAFIDCPHITRIDVKSKSIEFDAYSITNCHVKTLVLPKDTYMNIDTFRSEFFRTQVSKIDEIIIETNDSFETWAKMPKEDWLKWYGLDPSTNIHTLAGV